MLKSIIISLFRAAPVLLFSLLLASLVLLGCSQTDTTSEPTPVPVATVAPTPTVPPTPPQPTAAIQPPSPTPKPERVTVRLDWLADGYHAPFFLALDKGWYAEKGLDVEVLDGKGSGNVAQMVATKSDTFGFADAGPVIRSVAEGMPVITVAGILRKSPFVYVSLKETGIKTPKDLEGKIRGTVPGSATTNLWPALIKGNNIDESKVTTVTIDPSTVDSSLLTEKVHFTPSLVAAQKERVKMAGKEAEELVIADWGVTFTGHGIIAHVDTLKQKPEMVRHFLEVTLRAWEYAKTHQAETITALLKQRPEKVKFKDYSSALLKATLEFLDSPNTKGKPIGWMSDKDWTGSLDTLVKFGDLKKTPNLEQLYTNDYLPK